MDHPDFITYVVDNSVCTSLIPIDQPLIHVSQDNDIQELIQQNVTASAVLPTRVHTVGKALRLSTFQSMTIILPVEGGGRGPVINSGQTINTSLLLTLLNEAIDEDELTPALQARLDAIPDLALTGQKNEEGYASNNDGITLSYDWAGRPSPKITLSLAPGVQQGIRETVVGVDPDCVTYQEIPPQEVIYGHTGITNENQFTVIAAFLEKGASTNIPVAFAPTSVTGVPILLTNTIGSSVFNTTLDCMLFRIKGSVSLNNAAAYDVQGAMFAQMRVDSGDWVNIAELFRSFDSTDSTLVTENFDVFIAAPQGAHTYEFRGELIVDSGTETNRRLTGGIAIDTVTESGTGSLISNDLLIKWEAKE